MDVLLSWCELGCARKLPEPGNDDWVEALARTSWLSSLCRCTGSVHYPEMHNSRGVSR